MGGIIWKQHKMTQREDPLEYQRLYRALNKEMVAEKARKVRLFKKQIVFNHYGNLCACCGEREPKFLSIDHVNNDGYVERKSRGGRSDAVILHIIRQNFPDTYQILCMNCNFGKSRNAGVCPHQLNS